MFSMDETVNRQVFSNNPAAAKKAMIFRQSALSTAVECLKSKAKSPTTLEQDNISQKDSNLPIAITSIMPSQPPLNDAPSVAPSGFVFGEGMSSRVTNANSLQSATLNLWEAASKEDDSLQDSATESEPVNSNCLFTKLAQIVTSRGESRPKCLEDSAAKVEEEQRRLKAELAKVDKVTGEENEESILKTSCKAYVFDKYKQTWSGLGASYLHLNDSSEIG
ncbi:unnamed protein product, partial [Protopolystoma xenopodis]